MVGGWNGFLESIFELTLTLPHTKTFHKVSTPGLGARGLEHLNFYSKFGVLSSTIVGRIVSIIYWRIDSINFGRNTR